jgi:nitrogen fixation/metabolism regulation signal transduction histidine kinase
VLAGRRHGRRAHDAEPPPLPALRLARLQQAYSKIDQAPDGGLVLRVVVPVNTEDALNSLKLLQIVEPVPKSLAQDAERVQAGVRDYQELSFSRAALKRLYALTLTLTLLLALTVALGLAGRAVRALRSTARLAGRRHARGCARRLHARQPWCRRTSSACSPSRSTPMTAQLAEAQGREQESRRAIETTRAYLESVLGNLSAGVLVFDEGTGCAW